MNCEVETILERFSEILKGEQTESIKKAEWKLEELQSKEGFLRELLSILDRDVPLNLKKMTVVYLNKYSRRLLWEKNLEKTALSLQQYMDSLKKEIPLEFKKLMIVPIDSLVNAECHRSLRKKMLQDLAAQLRMAHQDTPQQAQLEYLVFYAQALTGSQAYAEELNLFIKQTFLPVLALTQRLLLVAPTAQQPLFDLLSEYSSLVVVYMKRVTLLELDCVELLFLKELESLITSTFQFDLPANQTGFSLFIEVSDQQLSRALNTVKGNMIGVLTATLRLLHTFVKNSKLLASNPVYEQMSSYLELMISSGGGLLKSCAYFGLKERSILRTLDEVFKLLLVSVRVNGFYQTFNQQQDVLLQDLMLRVLQYSPLESQQFYEQPEEFVYHLLQIVEKDVKKPSRKHDPEDAVHQFETLKTQASDFLIVYCKFQDGILTKIFQLALLVLSGQLKTEFDPKVFLVVIGLLKHLIKQREDLKFQLLETVSSWFQQHGLPTPDQQSPDGRDIEYALHLMIISLYFPFLVEIYPAMVEDTFKIASNILLAPDSHEVYRLFALEMFENLNMVEEGNKYSLPTLAIFVELLKAPLLSLKVLDALFSLVKYNDEDLKAHPQAVAQALQLLAHQVQQEVNKPHPVQLFINKCWNIIREVGENELYLPQIIPHIESLILPLLKYIDGVKNYDFEEDVLMLMTTWIQRTKTVTVNQQAMFEIIPKVFYNQYNYHFGHSFHTLQIFIFYGQEVLIKHPKAIEEVVNMAKMSIQTTKLNGKTLSEVDNCEGAITLQSLILGCGKVLRAEVWTGILQVIEKRLFCNNIRNMLLYSNLVGLMALVLLYAHGCFPQEDNLLLLTKVLASVKKFNSVPYSPKLMIVSLGQLLASAEQQFVRLKYVQVLDIVITLLQISAIKKETLEEDLFGDDNDEEREYMNVLFMVKNPVKDLDEFQFFKTQIQLLKQQHPALLTNSLAQLPETKRIFLKNILSTQRVQNEPRKIFKIKR